MYYPETSCAIRVRAQAGGELVGVDTDVTEAGYAHATASQKGQKGAGASSHGRLLRRLARIDPSYRT
jgi:hypothetical protein